MIARGFKSVIWVATVGSAALGCYMVSLRVATERNELAKVEHQIVETQRDIRSLQTELGTRGRMTQLEQWNAEVLALAAPSSQQFLKDEFTLARLYRNDPTVAERSAEVRLASAEAPAAAPAEAAKPQAPAIVRAVGEPPAAQPPMIHRASFTTATAEAPVKARPEAPKPARPAARGAAPASTAKAEATPAQGSAKPGKAPEPRTASATSTKPQPDSARKAVALAAKPAAKPAAIAAKPATKPAAPAAKPAMKPAVAAARPVREAAAEPRQARAKGSGGN